MRRVWLTAIGLGLLLAGPVLPQDDDLCLECHADPDLTGFNDQDEEVSMYVPADALDSSVHAGFSCVDCHQSLAGVEDYPHDEALPSVDCGACHEDVADTFALSTHGQVVDNPLAPDCAACHGEHDIRPVGDSASKVSAQNLPHTCASCHHKLALKQDPDIHLVDAYDRYMRGIHARRLAEGVTTAASCNDCHGAHDLKKAVDPDSRVNKLRVPQTCAQCHQETYTQYQRGIHGKALAAGILDSPNCTDCHGEHEILNVDDPESPINPSNLAEYVCGRCHNDPQIMQKYGLSADRFSSYQDSYHGLALHGGSVKAASCVSCHEAHEILPAGNPASSVSPQNVVATCRKCHPRANASFAMSYSHDVVEAEFHGITSTVRNI